MERLVLNKMDAMEIYKASKPALRFLAFYGAVLICGGLEDLWGVGVIIGSLLLSVGVFGWE